MALIGKSSRQSVLDDNSSLYQPAAKKTEKQKWSEMNMQQRIHYFFDYYSLKCVIILAVAIMAILLFRQILSPKMEPVISISILHHSLSMEQKDSLEKKLTELFIMDPDKQEIVVDDNFPEGYESEIKLQAYMAGQNIDLIITDKDHFSELASFGYFEDLSELIPNIEENYSDFLYWTNGYTEEDTSATPENNDDRSDHAQVNDLDNEQAKPYGIHVTNSNFFTGTKSSDSQVIAGIVVNSRQRDYSVTAVEKLFLP